MTQLTAMVDTVVNFELEIPAPGVCHLIFDTQRDLAQTMMRLQEYYEGSSDLICGNYFTLEQFIHHFTDSEGHFDYTHSWSGFNLPGHVVDEWELLFKSKDGLTHKEQQMMLALSLHRTADSKWYLIGTAKATSSKIVIHELAHARYYLDPRYKTACDQLTATLAKKDRRYMNSMLAKMGYNKKVELDEIQAYLSTSTGAELDNWFFKLSADAKPVIRKFRKLFKSHSN